MGLIRFYQTCKILIIGGLWSIWELYTIFQLFCKSKITPKKNVCFFKKHFENYSVDILLVTKTLSRCGCLFKFLNERQLTTSKSSTLINAPLLSVLSCLFICLLVDSSSYRNLRWLELVTPSQTSYMAIIKTSLGRDSSSIHLLYHGLFASKHKTIHIVCSVSLMKSKISFIFSTLVTPCMKHLLQVCCSRVKILCPPVSTIKSEILLNQ